MKNKYLTKILVIIFAFIVGFTILLPSNVHAVTATTISDVSITVDYSKLNGVVAIGNEIPADRLVAPFVTGINTPGVTLVVEGWWVNDGSRWINTHRGTNWNVTEHNFVAGSQYAFAWRLTPTNSPAEVFSYPGLNVTETHGLTVEDLYLADNNYIGLVVLGSVNDIQNNINGGATSEKAPLTGDNGVGFPVALMFVAVAGVGIILRKKFLVNKH